MSDESGGVVRRAEYARYEDRLCSILRVLRGIEHDDERTPVTYTLQEVGTDGLHALPGELVAA
jgi:hypothetical protein